MTAFSKWSPGNFCIREVQCSLWVLAEFTFIPVGTTTTMMLCIVMAVMLPTLPTIGTERMSMPSTVLGTKLRHGILAKPPRQRLRNGIVMSLVARAAEFFHVRDRVDIFRRTGCSIQAKMVVFDILSVVVRSKVFVVIVALANVHLAFQPRKAVGTGTVHSILLLFGMHGQVQSVVRVLVPLDTESTRSTIAIQVAHRFDIALYFAQIARPARVANAALVTSVRIRDAPPVTRTKGILPILIQPRRAARRALVLAARARIRNVLRVGRVAIAHGGSAVVVRARRSVVAVLLRSASLHGDLAPQSGVSVGADAVFAALGDDVGGERGGEGTGADEVVV